MCVNRAFSHVFQFRKNRLDKFPGENLETASLSQHERQVKLKIISLNLIPDFVPVSAADKGRMLVD